MDITISQGHYDFAHPSERQDHARLVLPIFEKPLNLTCPEDTIIELRGEDWSEIVPEILNVYIEKTFWSSNLEDAKKALEWAESDEGQEALQKAWAEKELGYVNKTLESLQKKKEKLENILQP